MEKDSDSEILITLVYIVSNQMLFFVLSLDSEPEVQVNWRFLVCSHIERGILLIEYT